LSTICIDASFVVEMLVPVATSFGSSLEELWLQWGVNRTDLVGPPLLFSEVTSVIREMVYRRRITPPSGEEAFQKFQSMQLSEVSFPGLNQRAWQLAVQFNQPRTYDSQYLALAEREGCEFWTTDRRLYNAVQPALPWVRLVAT